MSSKNPSEKLPTRLVGLDVARAIAFVGMVLVNFKVAMGANSQGPGWLATMTGLLEGRAAATFVMLAGIGVSLGARSSLRRSGGLSAQRRTVLKRALVLFCFGLCYTPIWPADILHFYGIYLVFAALLISRSDRSLLVVTGSLPLLFVLLAGVLDYEAGWDWTTLEYSGMWTVSGMVRHLFFNGFHPVVPWLSFLLFGMWLGRQDLSCSIFRQRALLFGLVMAASAEILSLVLLRTLGCDDPDLDALLGTAPMPPVPLYVLAAGSTSVVVIVLCLMLADRIPKSGLIDVLQKTGQLALTLYVAHVLVGMAVLDELGWLESGSLNLAVTASFVFCGGSLIFAILWRRFCERGPLEWLMRRLAG